MFKNANILYEIKNSKRQREIFYEMDPQVPQLAEISDEHPMHYDS